MPWLVVLGHASWKMGAVPYQVEENGRTVTRYTPADEYTAGKHEVSDEVAEAARRSGLRSLKVLGNEPEIVDRDDPQWHGNEGRVRYADTGVQLPAVDDVVPEAAEGGTEALGTYQCPFCPETRPSNPALARHCAVAHSG